MSSVQGINKRKNVTSQGFKCRQVSHFLLVLYYKIIFGQICCLGNFRTLWLKFYLPFCFLALPSARISFLRQQCIWLSAAYNWPPQSFLLNLISFLRPRCCCKIFHRTNSHELVHTMVTAFFFSAICFNTISQFRPSPTGPLRNVPYAAESPAEKPDADTATSPLLPSTLGHLRPGAPQGSEKGNIIFINLKEYIHSQALYTIINKDTVLK